MVDPRNLARRGFLKFGAAVGLATPLATGLAAEPKSVLSDGYAVPLPPEISVPVAASNRRFPVRRIHGLGRNYPALFREQGLDPKASPPIFFSKHRDAIVQDGSTIRYPLLTKEFRHEVELVVFMKSGGANIPAEEALDHVYGYAVGLDMTRWDLLQDAKNHGAPWEFGKSFDEAAPCAAIRPVSKVGHINSGKIKIDVNGQTRVEADLRDMIWKVPDIIHHLSAAVALEAGDVIYTGTPGTGLVNTGDHMVGEIEGLGSITIAIA